MKRSGPIRRKTALNRYSRRRKLRDAKYDEAREAVYAREAGVCQVRTAPDCTWRVEQIHHRAGRGGPDPHRLENLVGCCQYCHALIHREPAWAYKHGWLKSRVRSI